MGRGMYVVDGGDEGSAFVWGGGRVDRFLVLRICRSGMKGMEGVLRVRSLQSIMEAHHGSIYCTQALSVLN